MYEYLLQHPVFELFHQMGLVGVANAQHSQAQNGQRPHARGARQVHRMHQKSEARYQLAQCVVGHAAHSGENDARDQDESRRRHALAHERHAGHSPH